MKKFDVIIGTPPYKTKAIVKYTEKMYDLSKDWVILLHQSRWITNNEKWAKVYAKYQNLKKKLGNDIEYLKFFNGSPDFSTQIPTPLVIDVINKNKKNSKIIVDDLINNKFNLEYDSIYQINRWNDTKVYPNLEKKFTKLIEEHGSYFDHADFSWDKKEKSGKYWITFAEFKGILDVKQHDNMYKPNFFSMLSKKDTITSKDDKIINIGISFVFNDKEKAQNFFDFSKTKWARFSLSIMKDIQSTSGALHYVPWLDWSQPWSFDKFSKLINATQEEIEFIEKNIPDYY